VKTTLELCRMVRFQQSLVSLHLSGLIFRLSAKVLDGVSSDNLRLSVAASIVNTLLIRQSSLECDLHLINTKMGYCHVEQD
jgi:hypothetical protein